MTAGVKRIMVKIGTHSGSFHCDEALGCYLLHQTEEFADGSVTRSRDPEVWKDMDVLIDVGAEYNPGTHRYDHHQRGFAEVFGHGYGTKLSSAGLVYKHFGRGIVARRLNKPEADADVQTVWLQVYRAFIEAIDAIDNGVNRFDTDAEPRFEEHTNLPARVGALNPAWNEPSAPEKQDACFEKAMALAGAEFEDAVRYTISSWLPARAIVEEALRAAPSVHASGEILKLAYCPWKSHLYDLEAEAGCPGKIKFVLYKDDAEGKWRVQAVNHPGSFALRKGLPAAWRGLRGAELDKASGIEGCVFVHAAGFIGGNGSEAGALQMAVGGLDAVAE